jgi:glutamate-1-semialdehyde 2,1-aminomutase
MPRSFPELRSRPDAVLAGIDRGDLSRLIRSEERRLASSTVASRAMHGRAREVLVGGVASSYQLADPWPLYMTHAQGAGLWDLDGTRRADFHSGFGAMVQGHAHPAIGRALQERYHRGTHFAAPTEDAVIVGEELARRWGLPKWRYTNSGSESTMDAIRIARGFTGREIVMKIFGSYHGHHDAVMVALGTGDADDPFDPPERSHGEGIPGAIADLTVAVPFNDAAAMERRIERLDAEGRKPACVILEPTMMLGLVAPEAGYLEAVRDITLRHGIVLIFDEVKTGLTVAAGGAVECYGVTPDIVTLAKALGGGLPSGAIGGSEEVMSVVEDGSVLQVGTYNGNALGMAAARANLLEVLTPDAYARLDELSARMITGCTAALEQHGLPGYALGVGARGCVTFASTRIRDYATMRTQHDPDLLRLTWLHAMNRGLYLTPARPEQWTLSVAHSDADVDAYVDAFAELARQLALLRRG